MKFAITDALTGVLAPTLDAVIGAMLIFAGLMLFSDFRLPLLCL
jgi:hypothetical protein